MLTLTRFHVTPSCQVGVLSFVGLPDVFTLEDPPRPAKIPKITGIPTGTYPLRLVSAGSLYERYSAKWDWHEEMIEVCDVPDFEAIMFHPGNRPHETEGCILVGRTLTLGYNHDFLLKESVAGYEFFYRSVYHTIKDHGLKLEIRDVFRRPPIV